MSMGSSSNCPPLNDKDLLALTVTLNRLWKMPYATHAASPEISGLCCLHLLQSVTPINKKKVLKTTPDLEIRPSHGEPLLSLSRAWCRPASLWPPYDVVKGLKSSTEF